MEPSEILLYAVPSLAAGALIASAFFFKWKRQDAVPLPRAATLDAQQLIHDLTRNGAAIVKIEVVDPANLLLRSPRT